MNPVFSLNEFKHSPYSGRPHYFVVGHPINHSLSPSMHQFALDKYGIEAGYHALNLLPNEISEFAAWMNREEFKGCNITIPYKKEFVSFVDELDDVAKEIGVINTIAKEGEKLIGHNTDVYGFTAPLKNYINHLEGGRAIIFGTGGASKAVQAGLEDLGVEELIFVSRNPVQHQAYSEFSWIHTVGYQEWQAFAGEAILFVNTTPLGMKPNTEQSPVSEQDSNLLEDKICYDLIYNPLQTRFLSLAQIQGAETLNGLDMLIHQGNRSFEIWTGKSFPYDDIKNLLIKGLIN